MSIANRVRELLDENGVEYEHIPHDPAYTAQEVAQQVHRPGREVAKVVILTDGDTNVMAVLPATRKIDLERIRHAAGSAELRLAEESEFEALFPNVETGAMAPFGNLYGITVFVDQSLREDEEITFNAGTHVDAIRMSYSDFERLVQPVAAEFSEPLAAR
ncbi:MAG TPA: YbaK/EbsC family protein [Gemmatimonadota bacterium]|nr:YbaK/EbsC family protein [Gemmatimonadota bacterium]